MGDDNNIPTSATKAPEQPPSYPRIIDPFGVRLGSEIQWDAPKESA